MGLEPYADTPPTQVGTIRIILESRLVNDADNQLVVEIVGRWRLTLVNDDLQTVEERNGTIQEISTELATTSISAANLAAWAPELRALAESVLP